MEGLNATTMQTTTQNARIIKYTDIFKIVIPEEFIIEQERRRSGQWGYSFKSLNGYRFQLNAQGENLSTKIIELLEQINENNYVSFIAELKELYIPARIQNEDLDPQGDFKTNCLLDQHFNRAEKTDEYRKQRDKAIKYLTTCVYNDNKSTIPKNFYEQIDENFDLPRSIVVKILSNEKLNSVEHHLFDKAFSENKKCLRSLDLDNELSNYLKLMAIGKSKNIDQGVISDMKIRMYYSCFTSIANRSTGVDRNSEMEADFFQTIYGLYESLKIINRFLKEKPENECSFLFRKYLKLKSNITLSYLNKPVLAYEALTANNIETHDDMKCILSNLLVIRTVIQYIEYETKETEETEETEIRDKDLIKKLKLEILKESMTLKLKILNSVLEDKIEQFSEDLPLIDLPNIEDFINSIDKEFDILEKSNIDNEKFSGKFFLLEKILNHFDDICTKLCNIKHGLKVDGKQTIDIESTKIAARAFNDLKNTLEDNKMYHRGTKTFIDRILDFFRRLFGKVEIHPATRNEFLIVKTTKSRSFSIVPHHFTLTDIQNGTGTVDTKPRSHTTT